MNQREIKFRAWDKKEKKMLEVLGIEYWIPQDSKDSGNIRSVRTYQGDLFFENIELMQFTGLKDKNGKKIYEGDIIRTISRGYRGIVTFQDGFFGMDGKYKDGMGCSMRTLSWYNGLGIEIIGNIYKLL